jgi:hypothetical protein
MQMALWVNGLFCAFWGQCLFVVSLGDKRVRIGWDLPLIHRTRQPGYHGP